MTRTKHGGDTYKAIVPNHAHFNTHSAFHCGDNGADAIFKEVSVFCRVTWRKQSQVHGQADRDQMGRELFDRSIRQGGQHAVLIGLLK